MALCFVVIGVPPSPLIASFSYSLPKTSATTGFMATVCHFPFASRGIFFATVVATNLGSMVAACCPIQEHAHPSMLCCWWLGDRVG